MKRKGCGIMIDLYGRVPKRKSGEEESGDTALIVALMLLLKSDGSDPLLIFALLYILT